MRTVSAFNVRQVPLAPSHAVRTETQEQLLTMSKANVFLNAQLLTPSSSQTHLAASVSTVLTLNAPNVSQHQPLMQLLSV